MYILKNNTFDLSSEKVHRIRKKLFCKKLHFAGYVLINMNQNQIAQSAGAVEYTDCFSAEG